MIDGRRQRVARTNLSLQAGALRLSLFVSLGLSPAACGGTSVTDATAQGGAGHRTPVCESPVTDPVSGLVECANGITHRPNAMHCALPSAASAGAPGEGSGDAGVAGADSAPSDPACEQDSDCGPGKLCHCDASAHGSYCETA